MVASVSFQGLRIESDKLRQNQRPNITLTPPDETYDGCIQLDDEVLDFSARLVDVANANQTNLCPSENDFRRFLRNRFNSLLPDLKKKHSFFRQYPKADQLILDAIEQNRFIVEKTVERKLNEAPHIPRLREVYFNNRLICVEDMVKLETWPIAQWPLGHQLAKLIYATCRKLLTQKGDEKVSLRLSPSSR